MHEWTDISILLKKNYNIEPVYWIHSSNFKEEISLNYPEAIFHDTSLANKAVAPEGIEINDNYLDKEFIENMMQTERDIYIMLNRHDLDGSFSFNERKDLYYEQLSYWMHVLVTYNIKLVVFSETPHAISHYIIYAICKYKKIDTIMLSFTNVQGLLYAKKSFSDVPLIPVEKSKDRFKKIIQYLCLVNAVMMIKSQKK